jgi:hypothetical protein
MMTFAKNKIVKHKRQGLQKHILLLSKIVLISYELRFVDCKLTSNFDACND